MTHTRLVDPVKVRFPDGRIGGAVHSRAAVLRKLPGCDLCLPGGPYEGLDAGCLVDDDEARRMLLHAPPTALTASVWRPCASAEAAAARRAAAAAEADAAARRAFSSLPAWAASSDLLLAARPDCRALRRTPPLGLKRSPHPATTVGADGLLRLCLGAVACSAMLSLYDPMGRRVEETDPDELAAKARDAAVTSGTARLHLLYPRLSG